MKINKEGRIELDDGRTTCPLGQNMLYIGNPTSFIAFDYLILPDDRVVLHSVLSLFGKGLVEDFLYEVVDRSEAIEAAESMVHDAAEFLCERGHLIFAESPGFSFVPKLQQHLLVGLH